MKTQEIQTNGKTYLVCEIPLNRHPIIVSGNILVTILNSVDESVGQESYPLPEYGFVMIGFASSLTEKEWAGILGMSTESGKSWLEVNGIAGWTNPFILIKK